MPRAPGLKITGATNRSASAMISFDSPARKAAVPVKINGRFRRFKEGNGLLQVRQRRPFRGDCFGGEILRRCFRALKRSVGTSR